jgi:hypothetical protein
MSETERRRKFVILAERRVANAIKQIRLIGNLSNKGNYSYTPKDAEKIVSALNREVRSMKARFDDGGGASESVFKL